MTPAPGDRLQRFVGDRVRFGLSDRDGRGVPEGWTAKLRTNLGRAVQLRREIVQAHTRGLSLAGASWRDLPMRREGGGWTLELPLAEPGFFKAKAYLIDPRGWQVWPAGPDAGIAVHPDGYRSANTIYCAFARMFGEPRAAVHRGRQAWESPARGAGSRAVTRSSRPRASCGTLIGVCRTSSTPWAAGSSTAAGQSDAYHLRALRAVWQPLCGLDLTAIDPALVEFDRRTTGIDSSASWPTRCTGAAAGFFWTSWSTTPAGVRACMEITRSGSCATPTAPSPARAPGA